MNRMFFIMFIALIGCEQNLNSIKSKELTVIGNDEYVSDIDTTNLFREYVTDGIFLKGDVRVYNNKLKKIGALSIPFIEPVKILSKTTLMYNVENSTDICDKACFVKVRYQNQEYIVFGKDIYEINNNEKHVAINEKQQKIVLLSITNFEMGASNEEGLTGCDDFSILMIHNNTTNKYLMVQFPENDSIRTGNFNPKQAVLFHDDGSDDKIYKLSIIEDTLIIGIKSIYQEGGASFNLKTLYGKDFSKSKITDKVVYETDNELQKMEELK